MRTTKALKTVGNTLMRVDLFGEKAEFQIKGQSTYQSLQGTIVSLAIFATVIAYAFNKSIIMLERGDTNQQNTVLKDAVDMTEALTYEKSHFNVAVGLFERATGLPIK